MTAPTQMTASTSPDDATRWAASGSSNAPGTHATVTVRASTPCSARPSSAPCTNRSVMSWLNRLAMTAMRSPRPFSPPWRGVHPPFVTRSLQSLQQMAHAFLLGPQVADVLRVGDRLQPHPFDDLQAVALQAAVLGRVVGEQAHGGDAEV